MGFRLTAGSIGKSREIAAAVIANCLVGAEMQLQQPGDIACVLYQQHSAGVQPHCVLPREVSGAAPCLFPFKTEIVTQLSHRA